MSYLEKYLEEKNIWRKLFGEELLSYPRDKQKILDMLDSDLSPENLTCDGELRGKALLQRANRLKYALKECS